MERLQESHFVPESQPTEDLSNPALEARAEHHAEFVRKEEEQLRSFRERAYSAVRGFLMVTMLVAAEHGMAPSAAAGESPEGQKIEQVHRQWETRKAYQSKGFQEKNFGKEGAHEVKIEFLTDDVEEYMKQYEVTFDQSNGEFAFGKDSKSRVLDFEASSQAQTVLIEVFTELLPSDSRALIKKLVIEATNSDGSHDIFLIKDGVLESNWSVTPEKK